MKDGGSLSTKSKKQFNDVNAEFILLGQVESENGNWVITLGNFNSPPLVVVKKY